jgi:hypothetical protein
MNKREKRHKMNRHWMRGALSLGASALLLAR